MPHLPAIVTVVAAILITVGRIGRRWPKCHLGFVLLAVAAPPLLCWAPTPKATGDERRVCQHYIGGLFADRLDDLVSEILRATEKADYRTQKPETLLALVIAASSKKDDLVLSSHGSGTTAVDAANAGGVAGSRSTLASLAIYSDRSSTRETRSHLEMQGRAVAIDSRARSPGDDLVRSTHPRVISIGAD